MIRIWVGVGRGEEGWRLGVEGIHLLSVDGEKNKSCQIVLEHELNY